MAYSRKHSPGPPASHASHLISIDAVTFWQHCAEAGERHYTTTCFSTGKKAACAGEFFNFFSFFLKNKYFHLKTSCGWTFPTATVWYTAIMHSPLKRSPTERLCVIECSPSPQLETLQLYSYECVMYGCVHVAVTLSTSVCLTLHFVVAISQYDVE